MEQQTDLLEILEHIDPASLHYQDWVNVGMGLKEAGYTSQDWEQWSSRDAARYHPGECAKKWDSFHGSVNPVTAGTIVQMAIHRGWRPVRDGGRELDWNDAISNDDLVIVNGNWLEGRDVAEPDDKNWEPVKELTTYLETLFDSTEFVGYVTRSWEQDGKYLDRKSVV